MSIVSSPEFLAEGTVVQDTIHPHKLVLGSDEADALIAVEELYRGYVATDHVVRCSHEEAELIKLSSKVMLATRIATVNKLVNPASVTGAAIDVVTRVLGRDVRLGSRFLVPGAGYDGSCFHKDCQATVSQAAGAGLEMPAIVASIVSNALQQRILGENMIAYFGGDSRGRTIAVLGAAFEEHSDDLRHISSVVLLAMQGQVRVCDPVPSVSQQLHGKYEGKGIVIADTIESALFGADAVCIMHANLAPPLEDLGRTLRTRLVVDARRMYSTSQVQDGGFDYLAIGGPPMIGRAAASSGIGRSQGALSLDFASFLVVPDVLPVGVRSRRADISVFGSRRPQLQPACGHSSPAAPLH